MDDPGKQPPRTLGARVARGLGAFNIAYGTLGLLSAAALRFAFPQDMNPLSDGAMLASAAASLWILSQGLLLRIYGPAVLAAAPNAVRRASAFARRLPDAASRLLAGRRA